MTKEAEYSVQTPKGVISVHPSSDTQYPGYYVAINGVALVLVEYDNTNDEHAIRVWSHEDPDNDYIYKQAIPNNFPDGLE